MLRRKPASSLSRRHQRRTVQSGSASRSRPTTAAPDQSSRLNQNFAGANHPLADSGENSYLYKYESSVKKTFDSVIPTLQKISVMQYEKNFEINAQAIARQELGFDLPDEIIKDAWVEKLDMRTLFAWCMFKTYHRFCDDFYTGAPLSNERVDEFQKFIEQCGFHTIDVSPCSDGRLAHALRYVLRLPIEVVRRRAYAGAMFDIDNSIKKWVKTEMLRFRQGMPNTADQPTRYLKAVAYHFSSVDPGHEGCAAHGSDDAKAAEEGLNRLLAFQQAIENSFCCGASIDLLLLGIDTDTDAIKVHVPDINGEIDLTKFVDAKDAFQQTLHLTATAAMQSIEQMIRDVQPGVSDGMVKLISKLLCNNLSQIEYVHDYFGSNYEDTGHAERLIGAGIGFDEIRLRNLAYIAYLNTLEESVDDLDVGIKIFSKLNVARGLPVPVVVRFDYKGQVPGDRERAVNRCHRVAEAIRSRYKELADKGYLHTLQAVRNCNANGQIEILGSSLKTAI